MQTNRLASTALPLTCASLLAVLVSAGCSPNQPPSDQGAKTASSDTASINAELAAWSKAFSAHDVDGIMALYSPDVRSFDMVPPLQIVGRDAYRKDYEGFLSLYKGPIEVEFRDVQTAVSGDLAVYMGLERLGGTLANGQKSAGWVRVTSVFRKVGGKWVDIHDHVSVPADMTTGKAAFDLEPSASQ